MHIFSKKMTSFQRSHNIKRVIILKNELRRNKGLVVSQRWSDDSFPFGPEQRPSADCWVSASASVSSAWSNCFTSADCAGVCDAVGGRGASASPSRRAAPSPGPIRIESFGRRETTPRSPPFSLQPRNSPSGNSPNCWSVIGWSISIDCAHRAINSPTVREASADQICLRLRLEKLRHVSTNKATLWVISITEVCFWIIGELHWTSSLWIL